MEYLVTQAEMKQYDNNTITRLKMPSLVLMERAALITVEQIRKERGDGAYRVLVVAGCGNNGGDGFAIGRIQKGGYVCAVDIPSGVHADSGQILGCAVKADLTVTYGFYKVGQFLYPGAGCCGKIICGQMGIDEHGFFGKSPGFYTYMSPHDVRLPERRPDGNKGTFGKALVIAGSGTICGAAVMAGKSVFRTGAGMV